MNRSQSQFKTYGVGLLMLIAAFAAWAMHPRILMSEQRNKVSLAELIPTGFGEWKELPQSGRQIVNPQQTAVLDEIYSETLSRAYVHPSGAIVMLSLAT